MCKFQKAKTVVKGRKKQILSTHVLSFYSQQWKQKVPNQRVKGVPNIYSASKLTQPKCNDDDTITPTIATVLLRPTKMTYTYKKKLKKSANKNKRKNGRASVKNANLGKHEEEQQPMFGKWSNGRAQEEEQEPTLKKGSTLGKPEEEKKCLGKKARRKRGINKREQWIFIWNC